MVSFYNVSSYILIRNKNNFGFTQFTSKNLPRKTALRIGNLKCIYIFFIL
jgi:hypothetical protein